MRAGLLSAASTSARHQSIASGAGHGRCACLTASRATKRERSPAVQLVMLTACGAGSVWQALYGRLSMAGSVWQALYGRLCMAGPCSDCSPSVCCPLLAPVARGKEAKAFKLACLLAVFNQATASTGGRGKAQARMAGQPAPPDTLLRVWHAPGAPLCVCVCVCWATVGRWCKVLLLFPCVNSRCGPRWPAMRHSSAYVNQGPQGTYFGTCGPARCVLVFFGRAGAGLHIAAPSLWRSLLLLPFSLCILSVIQLPWRSSVHSPPKM